MNCLYSLKVILGHLMNDLTLNCNVCGRSARHEAFRGRLGVLAVRSLYSDVIGTNKKHQEHLGKRDPESFLLFYWSNVSVLMSYPYFSFRMEDVVAVWSHAVSVQANCNWYIVKIMMDYLCIMWLLIQVFGDCLPCVSRVCTDGDRKLVINVAQVMKMLR